MENVSNKLMVNLITTPEELSAFFKGLINESLQEHELAKKEQEIIKEELFTIKQAALFFQVSETTIHAWKNNGVLPYIKVKSRIRFKKSEMLTLFEKRRGRRRLHL